MRLIKTLLLLAPLIVADEDDEAFSPNVHEASVKDGQQTVELEDPSEVLGDGLDDVKPQASYQFQAETDRLMDIIVHSLYTERDVFLRELVSNSADALEKFRVSQLLDRSSSSVTSSSEDEFDDELKIMVKVNKYKQEISIIDNGIGMSRDELEKNLGTVAKSGTSQFMEAAKRGEKASNLIGQFGVGFYSAFLVADKVTVISKRAEDKDRYIWQSTAKGGFSISKDTRKNVDFDRGTIVTLKLKDDAKELYTDKYKIKYILQRFSAFVPFPIYLGEVRGDATKKIAWQRTNGNKPLWLRDRADISEEEYIDFYKNYTKTPVPPVAWTHFKAEGDYEFNGLFYLPAKAPASQQSNEVDVKLYVQRVLITDQLEDFLPKYLSFMKGVVDSNDLPLKVDRENFSQMKVMRVMKKKAFTKIFEMFNKLIKDAKSEKDALEAEVTKIRKDEAGESSPPKSLMDIVDELGPKFPKYQKFNQFWRHYGDHILTGCVEPDITSKEKDKILSIYHTHTTYGNKLLTTLEDYVSRMLPGQKSIYVMTGDNLDLMMKSPYIEFFVKHGVEVLLLTGPYDEQCLVQTYTWKKYDIISIEMDQMLKIEDLAFALVNSDVEEGKYSISTEEDQTERKNDVIEEFKVRQLAFNKMYRPLVNWVNKRLKKAFKGEVKLTQTLPFSPARISIPFTGFTANHERLARTTINVDKRMIEDMSKNKNFELNPNHPLVYHLLKEVNAVTRDRKKQKESDSLIERERQINHMIDMLYESALIACGFLSRRPYLLLDDFFRLVQVEQNLDTTQVTVEIPEDLLEEARDKVSADRPRKRRQLEEDSDEEEEEWFNEKDEL